MTRAGGPPASRRSRRATSAAASSRSTDGGRGAAGAVTPAMIADERRNADPKSAGGSAWESNPPGRVRRNRTRFEDGGAHRDPTAPVRDGSAAMGRDTRPSVAPVGYCSVVWVRKGEIPVTCASCGAENDAGRKFCLDCGTSLAATCPACAPAPAHPATHAPAIAERRVVSVLFADLVGFTTLAENRDAEEVRDLLSRYFDLARGVVERHGGTIEKFIGDAVMAVWGAPTSHEDD